MDDRSVLREGLLKISRSLVDDGLEAALDTMQDVLTDRAFNGALARSLLCRSERVGDVVQAFFRAMASAAPDTPTSAARKAETAASVMGAARELLKGK